MSISIWKFTFLTLILIFGPLGAHATSCSTVLIIASEGRLLYEDLAPTASVKKTAVVKLMDGTELRGVVSAVRLSGLGIISEKSGQEVVIPISRIRSAEVVLNIKASTHEGFRTQYSEATEVKFEAPWGPVDVALARSAMQNKVAIYAVDPNNFNQGEIVEGRLRAGFPDSPTYDIETSTGEIRSIFYLYVHEMRIL